MNKVDVSQNDAQSIAELALSLRNFSYLLNDLATDEASLDRQKITACLFALHRQVDGVSGRLQKLSNECRTCINNTDRFACAGSFAVSSAGGTTDPPLQAQGRTNTEGG